MMKQRRRMLIAGGIDLDRAFSTAVYVSSDGADFKDDSDYARIAKSLLLSNKVYYLFGYNDRNLVIFKYYNGVLYELYKYTYSHDLSCYSDSQYIYLSVDGSIMQQAFGLTVLSFSQNMDGAFSAFSTELASGSNSTSTSASSFIRSISNKYDNGTRYMFTGISNRFCVYKIKGTTYEYLTPLFNHNLYLKSYSDGTYMQNSIDGTTVLESWGYTEVSLKS